MKKCFAFMLLAAAFVGSSTANAQTILDEGFETGSTETYSQPVAEGWTTVNSYSGSTTKFNWSNYYSEKGTITGKHVAQCDGASYQDEGQGPREEILLTPELDLNNTYQLSFDWKVSPQAYMDTHRYDLQVRIVENGDVNNAETIFSIQNMEDLKASGVAYPFEGWSVQTSKIDLSEWQGKKIKIAFVYKMLTEKSNVVYLDNVLVKQAAPVTGPVASINKTSYDYGTVYMGEKFYSEVFKLQNTGKKGLKITSVDLPSGVTMNIDPTTVDLDVMDAVQFQFVYNAALTTPADADAVIHTNGGDITVKLKATKTMVPDGLTEETFEAYFPPAGWKNDGWSATASALEGDRSVYAGVSLSENYLTSPRLDLTKGGKVMFQYYNDFTSNDGSTYQSNDIFLELSTDGGKTWTEKWKFDYQNDEVQNKALFVTVDLGVGTDDSYVRWHNTAVTSNDGDVPETSSFYLDRIFLPTLYGADGVPGKVKYLTPANEEKNVFAKNIKFEWTPAQFAKTYKIYIGKSSGNYDVANGNDMGSNLTFTLPVADYETTYYWKVVGVNVKGETADAEEYTFTTQKDATNTEYPYVMDFTGLDNLPAGWTSESTLTQYENRKWSILSGKGNPAPCLFNMWLDKGNHSSVTTPEFKLPEGQEVNISFDWVDQHPTDAIADESGLAKKFNVEGETGNGIEKVTFEINVDGEWKELAWLSQDYEKAAVNTSMGERYYWINENFDLKQYAGKVVQFRWTHYSYSGNDTGCGLDNVLIEVKSDNKVIFNKNNWEAGKVNYNQAVNSGDIFTLLNKGEQVQKIKKISFATPNFATSLAVGDEIAAKDGKKFNVQFNALQSAADVEDNLTIEFESGYSISLPVKGTGLAEDIAYYAFEKNDLDHPWKAEFTLIDVDHSATVPFTCYGTDFPESGTVYAFAAAYETSNLKNVAPVSGQGFLIPGSPLDSETKGDNWIVSKKLTATAQSTFDFWARNWESKNSVLPAGMHKVGVYVSETTPSDTKAFTEVMKLQEIPYLDGNEWKHYSVDLSAYAGKDIYIGVRDYTDGYRLAAFYDDFTFSHFGGTTGIKTVSSEITSDAKVTVYNMNGIEVVKGQGMETLKTLAKGAYIVKVQTAEGTKTMKIARR